MSNEPTPTVSRARSEGGSPAHHPTLYRTDRYGCWGFCKCGWESPVLSNVMSVHLAFGIHLVETLERDLRSHYARADRIEGQS